LKNTDSVGCLTPVQRIDEITGREHTEDMQFITALQFEKSSVRHLTTNHGSAKTHEGMKASLACCWHFQCDPSHVVGISNMGNEEHTHSHFGGILELLSSSVCTILILILLVWDVCKALKRRAHWIPSVALVLSALTIQMLGLIDFWDIRYMDHKRKREKRSGRSAKRRSAGN